MKKILLLSAISLFTATAYSSEYNNLYLEGKFSQNWLNYQYSEIGYAGKPELKDNVVGGSLEFGIKTDNFRAGVEIYLNDKGYALFEDNLFPVELKSQGIFLNIYHDFLIPENQKVKPFINAGVGYNFLKMTADLRSYGYDKETIKDESLGWNIGFGISYNINNNSDLLIGYRYENLGKITDEDSKTDVINNKIYIGLRVKN